MSVVTVVAKFTQKHFLGIAGSLVSAQLPAWATSSSSAHTFLVLKLWGLGQQNLCAKLMFLYCSPGTTIKWTHWCPPAPRHPHTQLPGLRGVRGSS